MRRSARLHKTIILAGLLVLLGVSCRAVTITENEALSKGDDPRLQQKVSLSAEGLRVADVLAQLTQSTGVVMAAGIDKDDWMVFDRKVIVYVSNTSLRDLMYEISRILSFHWSRGGEEGKWTYRLWQDKDGETEEQRLRNGTEDAVARLEREKRENAIADLVNLGSLGANDAGRLKDTDPWRYILATEPLGRDVAEFMHSCPDARSAFASGVSASFPVATLPPAQQDMVRRIATSYDALTKSIGAAEDHSDLLAGFDRLQVTINRGSQAGGDIVSRSILGHIKIGSGSEMLDIPLFDPSGPMAKAFGAAVFKLRSGVSKDEVGKYLQQELQAAADVREEKQASDRDITSDPALRAKVTLFPDWSVTASLPAVLGAVAKTAKLNVISDYFLSTPPTLAGGGRALGEQLELIRRAYGSNWEKAGSTLRFRDSEWFRKRAWEVPQVWIDYWVARGKRNNGLNLQDFAQIGNLRDEQIDHAIMTEPRLVRLGAGDAARNRHILRFYGALTEEQRTALTASQLPASAITDTRWASLQAALSAAGAAYAGAAKGSQFVRLTQSGADVIEYKFYVYPGQGAEPIVFKLTTGVTYGAKEDFPEAPKPAP